MFHARPCWLLTPATFRTAFTVLWLVSQASAEQVPCEPRWVEGFARPGPSAAVVALIGYNDGGGPALFAGGQFTSVGGSVANRVARWNGTHWAALGNGVDDLVFALTVFDDGRGPALYAGGRFTSAGGVAANRIAKWNGITWSSLRSGVGGSLYPEVLALTVYDDGRGPALIAGGDFITADGVEVNHIAQWNGSRWTPLGTGVAGFSYLEIRALAVFDDGSGPALYAGGLFTIAGGVTANRIARWQDGAWSALGSGMSSIHDEVIALTVYNDGHGPSLYAGGVFASAGGVAANSIAKWDGSGWSPLGSGLGGVPNPTVRALAVYDNGRGPALQVGGYFRTAGGVAANSIAEWDGEGWAALGNGMNSWVYALSVFDSDSGPALFAGGTFTNAGGAPADRIAKWTGCAPPARPGDMNCDGVVNFNDIAGFVAALVGESAYVDVLPGCRWLHADIDDNGAIDFNDIGGFVDCLVAGGCV